MRSTPFQKESMLNEYLTNGYRDDEIADRRPENGREGTFGDSGGRVLQKRKNHTQVNLLVWLLGVSDSCSAYLEVSADVGPRQDANGGREENGKHLEEVVLGSSPVGFQVRYEDIAW